VQKITIPEFPAFATCKAYVNADTNQNGTVAISATRCGLKSEHVALGAGNSSSVWLFISG
jgi:hypothetical protein